MISVSAPAKIHLMGEHTVVYGKPALLTAINRRLFVSIKPFKHGIKIESKESDSLVQHVLDVMQKAYQIEELPSMRLIISSNIPVAVGLGSSAAVAVATLGALHLFLKKGWNLQKINSLAYEIEKKQHIHPSGGDNTIATCGGFLWYRKEFEFLKSMWQLPFRLSSLIADKFILIDSGVPKETTGEMVKKVKSKVNLACRQAGGQKSKVEKIFHSQEQLTKKLVLALKGANEKELIKIIKRGERNLEQLGVVGERAALMIRTIEAEGGAAKISGAGGVEGGSGMLLCYHPEKKELANLVKKKGWKMIQIKLGEEGIRNEMTNS